jgi:hypothetical protein
MRGDVVVPLPVARHLVPPVTHLRSTLLLSSVLTLKARGLYPSYLAKLPLSRHASIDALVAGAWLPVELAAAHYDACDALELSTHEQLEMGTLVADQVQGGLLTTIVRAARNANASPWTAIESYPKLWERLMLGGAVTIDRLGAKDALIEAVGVSLATNRYFRTAFRGVNHAAFAPLCERLVVKDMPEYGFACRISWV